PRRARCRRYRHAFSAFGPGLARCALFHLPAPCRRSRREGRWNHRPSRRDADLRAAEDRSASRGDDGVHRRDPGAPKRARQRQGDDDREARLHRARRRDRCAGHRHDPPAPLMASIAAKIQALGLPFHHPAVLLATWFGAGLLPKLPGTWGSLAALPFAWPLATWFGPLALIVAAAVA